MKLSDKDTVEMVVFPVVNEACHVLAEGITVKAIDLDIAAIMGMGFPPYRGEILFWADSLGSRYICSRLEEWSKIYREIFKPSAYLAERAAKGASLVLVGAAVLDYSNWYCIDLYITWTLLIGLRPSSFTVSGILLACATVANSKRGKEIHGYALVVEVEEDIFVSSSLVDMYAKCGFIHEAGTLFNKMNKKDTVTWNSMIFGYANHGYCNEAIALVNQMVEEVQLDHLTFTAALTTCSHAGMVEVGWKIFHMMREEHGIEARLEHYACIVDCVG